MVCAFELSCGSTIIKYNFRAPFFSTFLKKNLVFLSLHAIVVAERLAVVFSNVCLEDAFNLS